MRGGQGFKDAPEHLAPDGRLVADVARDGLREQACALGKLLAPDRKLERCFKGEAKAAHGVRMNKSLLNARFLLQAWGEMCILQT